MTTIKRAVASSLMIVAPAWSQSIFEQSKFLSDSPQLSDSFGEAIDFENNTLVVGAGNGQSVYLFDATTGIQTFSLVPAEAQISGEFGRSVALEGSTVVVGVPSYLELGVETGAVILFDSTTGLETVKLLAGDSQERDGFGGSVAIDNGIVAVGAYRASDGNGDSTGALYLFDANTGTQITKIIPDDADLGDTFGVRVAMGNGLVAAASTFDDLGSVYIFDVKTGEQIVKLVPEEGYSDLDWSFGLSIAFHNDIVVIGATNAIHPEGGTTGAAYVFDARSGEQLTKIFPKTTEGTINSSFGASVGISDSFIVIGATQAYYGSHVAGAAYLFDATTYAQVAKLFPREPQTGQNFGASVSIQNDIVALGSSTGGGQALFYGSAYIHDTNVVCTADLAADGVLNFFDISAFLQAFGQNDPVADFDNNTLFNFFDISAFLQAFAAGCP